MIDRTVELTSRPNSLRKKEHRLAVWWSAWLGMAHQVQIWCFYMIQSGELITLPCGLFI